MQNFTASSARARWFAQPLGRARRRALVLATYASFVAFMLSMYAGYTSAPRWPAPLAVLAVVLVVATGAIFIRVVTSPGYTADTADRALDARTPTSTSSLPRDSAGPAAWGAR